MHQGAQSVQARRDWLNAFPSSGPLRQNVQKNVTRKMGPGVAPGNSADPDRPYLTIRCSGSIGRRWRSRSPPKIQVVNGD